MLIAYQNFRSRMIGHYIRSITCNMCETWGLIYSCTMRTLPMSCHVVLLMQRHHVLSNVYVVCQELLMDVPFTQAEGYLSKLTASHFGTLNMKYANQNVLERILIAMHNENKANCNEIFRICAEEPVAPLYKW